MEYLISFLEGIITFVSPCLLPMLPIYLSYFAGEEPEAKQRRTLLHAFGFITGFTLVFVALGAFAGSLGSLLTRYKTIVNLITGAVVFVFGLNFLGIFQIKALNQTKKAKTKVQPHNFISSLLFGVVFSIGWTPCVGAFLGSALMLASQQGSVVKGTILLLVYSMGLGVPFLLSALLIERLKRTFAWVKRNYRVVTMISGALLVLVGILMMTGLMDRILSLLSF